MEASPHWHLLADFSDQVRPHVDQTLQSVNTLIRQLAGHCSSDTLAATVVRVHSSLAAVHRVGVQHLQHSLRRLESLANALARLRSELKANDDRLQRLLASALLSLALLPLQYAFSNSNKGIERTPVLVLMIEL